MTRVPCTRDIPRRRSPQFDQWARFSTPAAAPFATTSKIAQTAILYRYRRCMLWRRAGTQGDAGNSPSTKISPLHIHRPPSLAQVNRIRMGDGGYNDFLSALG
jgi:hypothetical protein